MVNVCMVICEPEMAWSLVVTGVVSHAVGEAEQLPVTGAATAAAAAAAMAAVSHPQTPSSDSRKGKTRTSINPRQLEILQAAYDRDPKPSRPSREEMASQTGLTMKVIQVWFQNRRSKDKKEGVFKEEPLSAASPATTPGHSLSSLGPSMAVTSSLPENGVAMLQQTMQSEVYMYMYMCIVHVCCYMLLLNVVQCGGVCDNAGNQENLWV